jgi:hypothetical protein
MQSCAAVRLIRAVASGKMMQHFRVLLFALIITACSSTTQRHGDTTIRQSTAIGKNTHETSMAATKEFLLQSAAADFHAHPPAKTLRFYNVRLGYVMASEGLRKYMLCGEFLSNPDSHHGERAFFMTIDSPGGPNGYGQFLSGEGIESCNDPSVTWSSTGDLASSLQSQFDTL